MSPLPKTQRSSAGGSVPPSSKAFLPSSRLLEALGSSSPWRSRRSIHISTCTGVPQVDLLVAICPPRHQTHHRRHSHPQHRPPSLPGRCLWPSLPTSHIWASSRCVREVSHEQTTQSCDICTLPEPPAQATDASLGLVGGTRRMHRFPGLFLTAQAAGVMRQGLCALPLQLGHRHRCRVLPADARATLLGLLRRFEHRHCV